MEIMMLLHLAPLAPHQTPAGFPVAMAIFLHSQRASYCLTQIL